jgi:hypothetical protein
MRVRPEWLLLALCLGGCTSPLIDQLNARQVASCVWWRGPLGYQHGVTATGGVEMQTCLAVPCQMVR